MNNADSRAISAQAAGVLGLKVAAAAVAFGVQVPLARILGTEHYGLYALTLSWVVIAGVFLRMGMDATLVRYVAVYGAEGNHGRLKALLLKALGAGAVLNAALCLTAWNVPAFSGMHLMQAGAALMVPATMNILLQAALRGLKRVLLAEFMEGIARPLLMLGLFLFSIGLVRGDPGHIWIWYGAYSAMAANVVAGVIVLAVLAAWLFWHMPRGVWRARADFTPWRDWMALALPMMVMAGMQMLIYRTDIVMIGALMDVHNAGIYAVAARMAELVGFAMLAANNIIAPVFAELHAGGQRERLAHVLRFSTRLVFAAGAMAALGLAVLGPVLVGLFGADFAPAAGPLVLLAAGQAVHAVGAPTAILMTMSGRQRPALLIFMASAALNLGLNVALIPLWGLYGAGAATALSFTAYSTFMYVYARKVLGLDPGLLPLSRKA